MSPTTPGGAGPADQPVPNGTGEYDDYWSDYSDDHGHIFEAFALETAGHAMRRGDIPEALIWLERALAPELPSFHDLADKITRYFGSQP